MHEWNTFVPEVNELPVTGLVFFGLRVRPGGSSMEALRGNASIEPLW